MVGGWVARCGTQGAALSTLAALGPLAGSTLPDVARLNYKFCTAGRALDAATAMGPVTDDQAPRLYVFLNDADTDVRRSVADYLGQAHPDRCGGGARPAR